MTLKKVLMQYLWNFQSHHKRLSGECHLQTYIELIDEPLVDIASSLLPLDTRYHLWYHPLPKEYYKTSLCPTPIAL